jgi:hypothetical protein
LIELIAAAPAASAFTFVLNRGSGELSFVVRGTAKLSFTDAELLGPNSTA